MRYIKFNDKNERLIFEGDTVQFDSPYVFLKDEIIDFLKIDKVTASVEDLKGSVGVKINYKFYSNDEEVYTYKNKMNALINASPEKEQKIRQHFEDVVFKECKPDEVIDLSIDQKTNPIDFSHEFAHKSKSIIETMLTHAEKESKKYSDDILLIHYGDQVATQNDSFLVEITEKVRKRCMEIHESLYYVEDEGGYYEGGFTHLRLTPKNKKEHSFDVEPVNAVGEHTLIAFQYDIDFEIAMLNEVNGKRKADLKIWKTENKGVLDDAEYKRIEDEKYNEIRTARIELKKTNKFLTGKPVKELFLGFAVSDSLLDYFFKEGCVIKKIEK